MKNSIVYTIVLQSAFMLVMYEPGYSQGRGHKPDSAFRPTDRLESRSQRGNQGAREHHNNQEYDLNKSHQGGLQKYHQGPNRHPRYDFNRGDRGRQNFRTRHFQNPAARGFRNNGHRGHGFARQQFRNQLQHKRAYGRGFQQGQRTERFRQENKILKEQIWKDGIMDLKERELLRENMKSFRHGSSPSQKRFENGKSNTN